MDSDAKKTPFSTTDIEQASPNALMELLRISSLEGSVLDQIARLHSRNDDLMEIVLNHPHVLPQTLFFLFNAASADFKKRMQQLKINPSTAAVKDFVPAEGSNEKETSEDDANPIEEESVEKLSLFQRVQRMTVSEKVQFALHGGKDARSLLLKDPNRQVSQAVLGSPKITEDEVLLIAQSRNVSDEILRTVGKNKEWLKNYSILFSLIGNPKTPLGISLPLLTMVKSKDLGILSKNKNVPEAVRMGANRLLAAKQKQS